MWALPVQTVVVVVVVVLAAVTVLGAAGAPAVAMVVDGDEAVVVGIVVVVAGGGVASSIRTNSFSSGVMGITSEVCPPRTGRKEQDGRSEPRPVLISFSIPHPLPGIKIIP